MSSDRSQDLLAARTVAVIEPQRALAQREAVSIYAFRQSLVDLAAISEAMPADLPRHRS
jgi:hypothetical protein